MNLVSSVEKLETFLNKHQHNQEINQHFSLIKNISKLEDKNRIIETINSYKDENKLLRIGIVGRVKAGKSSLLNSLLFDGEDILPKAATPMTAALTVMKYRENRGAEVDFFTEQDIQALEKEAKTLKEYKENLAEKYTQEERNKRPEKQNFDRINKKVERKLRKKHSDLCSSADQYERIINSHTSLEELQKLKHISANSMQELNEKLKDFVSADGKYMPFTKSVTLFLPEESLKGLEIVDTPGMNDPVASRSHRTQELLSLCDVVLMVSPAGQFLSDDDMNLILEMTEFKGIGEIYLIASKCDDQLMGSEYTNLPFNKVLDDISSKLNNQSKTIFSQKSYRINDEVCQKFNESELVLTSSTCYTLAKNIENTNLWDENQAHTYKLLTTYFSNNFTNKEKSIESLNQLSNINKIQSLIQKVLPKKNEIFSKKVVDYESGQFNALQDICKRLEELITTNIQEIKENTLETMKIKQAHFDQIKSSVKQIVDDKYQQSQSDFGNLSQALNNALKQKMNLFDKGCKEKGYDERTESRERRVSGSTLRKVASWLTFGLVDSDRWETYYVTVPYEYSYVNATPIRNSINKILGILNQALQETTNEVIDNTKNKLHTELKSELGKIDKEKLNRTTVKKVLDLTLSRLPKAEFKIDSLPSELDKTGKLRDSSGDEYLHKARNYVEQLEKNIQKQIQKYVSSVLYDLENLDLSAHFLDLFQKDIDRLLDDIKNSETRLAEYQQMLSEIKEI